MRALRPVLVTGATGAQGGSVARHLLSSGQFTVRALTRSPGSAAAGTLGRAGAHLISGDMDDPASLREAMRGCWGVFAVTNFWEHFGKELRQGRNLVDAMVKENVACAVFSTLPPAKKISGGKLDVPHFDIKAELEDYARSRGLPAIFLHVAFYYENYLNFFPPKRQADGSFAFGFPQGDTSLAMIAAEDVGGIVAPLMLDPARFMGKVVGAVGDDLPPPEQARIMTEILGRCIVYNYVPREVFAAYPFPGAEDLANMFEFNRLYIPNRRADLEQSRALYPQLQTFEAWLRANKAKFEPILAS